MSFFGSLFGGDATKAIKKASKQARSDLGAGYTEGNQYLDTAAKLFDSYVSQGTQANTAYTNALGLNGTEAQTTAEDAYFNDPAMAAVLGQQSNALLRKYNASGSGTGGGRLALAGTRVGLENYNNYLNRLQGAGQQGLTATGAQAGVRSDQGAMRYGYGATLAGEDVNRGNALAQASTLPLNNLLNAVGVAGKAYTAFSDIRLKRDIERVGALPSGLPVYEFSYVWGPERYRGVLAQEAMDLFPEAISMHDSGYYLVDYSRVS